MNTKEKQALNEKIAKWCGFKLKVFKSTGDKSWKYPDNKYFDDLYPPNFCDSMDALIKWVIEPNQGFLNKQPKGILNWKMSNTIPNVITYPMAKVWITYKRLLPDGKNFSKWYAADAENESLSMALSLTIEKLIDSERK